MNQPPPGGGGVEGGADAAAPPGPGQPQPAETLLSGAEAARYLRISASTIHRWAVSGRLRFTTSEGGRMRFARVDLDAACVALPPESPGTRGKRLR